MVEKEKATKEEIVAKVKNIIAQYGGMRLTLRQIFYRLVAGQVIVNSEHSYKRLGRILVEARKSKKIRYTDIEDRTRAVHSPTGQDEYTSASWFRRFYDHIRELDDSYSLPRWWGQKTQVVVFLEKEALSALFEDVTDRLKVDLVVCRGYPSLTLMYEVASHLSKSPEGVEEVEFIYFGDYDPSGADIERHVGEELSTTFGIDFNIMRKAITRDQIDEYNIPPAPAKQTDSRTAGFEEREGVSWQVELDAIEPKILQSMIEEEIEQYYSAEQAEVRAKELEKRREKIRGWLDDAFNEDFEPPDEDEEDE